MIDCQMEQGRKHSWSVIGHSSGPAALLFLQCIDCGVDWVLSLTEEEWSDYLTELGEAGRVWLARHLGLPYPFYRPSDDELVAHNEGDGMTVSLWKVNKVADLVDDLDLFEGEDNEDVPF